MSARSLDDEIVLRELRVYREALESGEQPDREAVLARFPGIRDELAAVLDALDLVHRASPELREGALPGPLGDFEIKREIGRGGMGVVYEAEQVSLQRRVALKTLPFVSALDENHRRRFENEARATARLEHAHIVPVHAVGFERGIHYYAMQYIAGLTLAEVIESLRRRQTSQPASHLLRGRSVQSREYCLACARLGAQAARALAYAHQQGVVHRDIKPANLILDDDGEVWVTDFGLASFRRNRTALTVTGELVGTGRYMSPEQWSAGHSPVDHRTDVYSLGATLYELITLERAFPGESTQALWVSITSRDPVPPGQYNPACSADLATILQKAMAKDPKDRYATALGLADDLDRVGDDRPILARPPSLGGRARHWLRRHRVAAAATVLVLATGGIAAHFLTGARDEVEQMQEEGEQIVELVHEADDLFFDGVARAGNPDDAASAMLDKAVAIYQRLGRVYPDMDQWRPAQAHLNCGCVHFRLGRLSTALTRFDEAIALFLRIGEGQPAAIGAGNAFMARAHTLGELGRRDEAVAALREAIRHYDAEQKVADWRGLWANFVRANWELGLLLWETDRDEARVCYRRALEPRNAWSLLWHPWVLAECPDPGIRDVRAALELAEKNRKTRHFAEGANGAREVWTVLGCARYRAGEHEGAVEALEKAMSVGRGGCGAEWYFAAMALWHMGEKKRARAMFDRSKEDSDTRLWRYGNWEIHALREEAAALLGVDEGR